MFAGKALSEALYVFTETKHLLKLIYFTAVFHISTIWKRHKVSDQESFFAGGIEMEHWLEMG